MKIRKYQKKDLKEIARIFREEFAKKPYNERWSEKGALERITKHYKNCFIFVLEDDGIVGFLIGEIFLWEAGNKGGINEIVVSSKFQGKGYGKKLIKYFEEFLKKKKVKKIQLMSVKKSAAFNVYKKLGFKDIGFVSMEKKIK